LWIFGGGVKCFAQDGQPHSLTATAVFSDVTLDWKTPTDAITLQWHDGQDYNGASGAQSDPEGGSVIYAAAKFTPSELKDYAGQTVESISYFEYREVYKAAVLIYEDGKVVAEQEADLQNFTKNSWRKVTLATPYTIPSGKTVMFAVRYEAGSNMDFVAICDSKPTKGKGNLYSYDGKTWKSDGAGDFLVTATLRNNATAEPDGYNIYRDGTKVNESALTAVTSYTLTGEADGTHTYKVAALYGTDEKMSSEVTASTTSILTALPPVSSLSGTVSDLNGTLTWTAPLAGGGEMTWSNGEFKQAIGGTSKTSPKVWIKQEFSAADMAAFPNHEIKDIKAYIGTEGGLTGVTAFVMKDGVIDYSQEATADELAAVKAGDWFTLTLTTPYALTAGSSYAFGFYYTHSAGMHPVGVDSGTAVESKGNSFSTSSVSSKGFNKTKPSWKTLSAGDIAGNFLLKATVEPLSDDAAKAKSVAGYDVYRDGSLVAKDITSTTYTDEVSDLGTYSYAVVAKSAEGKTSPAVTTYLTYNLPEAYAAPVILDYDQTGKDISFSWSAEAKELKHYGTASYLFGFDEETALIYGAKFTKEELADYVGYSIQQLKFGIGAELDSFKLEVYTSDKENIFSREYKKGDIEPGYIYSTILGDEDKITIPADKDLYLVYNTTLPAGVSPILLDAGPAVDGGAVISFTNGASWMNLGTVASTAKDYNIVIGALAVAPAAEQAAVGVKAKAGAISLSSTPIDGTNITPMVVKADLTATEEAEAFGVSSTAKAQKAAAKVESKPKVASYNVYRNGEMVSSGTATSYKETLSRYGTFTYNITAVYENGWESAASKTLTFNNLIAQKTQAPYDLKGEATGKDLKLTWNAVSAAPELSYQTGEADNAYGLTSSSGKAIESWQIIKFKADEIADKVGQEVSHIKFKLNETNVNTASVVVLYGENIVYEQSIDIDSLVAGWNNIRLNNPVKVAEGKDLGVGYHITYASGVHPYVCDEGPAVSGYGDIITTSAMPGYFYSFKTKYKIDYNWRIAATLKTADVEVKAAKVAAEEAAVTYNVYRDGATVETGLTATELNISDAPSGRYTVTAVTSDGESAESNAVVYTGTSAIASPTVTNEANSAAVYGVDGRMVSTSGSTVGLQKGIYIINGKKFVVK